MTVDRGILYHMFWNEFIEHFYATDALARKRIEIEAPGNHYDLNIKVGVTPIYIELVIHMKKLQARIYFKDSQKVFDRLKEDEEKVNELLGEAAQFEDRKNGISKIIIEHEFDLNNKSDWKNGINWLEDAVLRLDNVIDTFIKSK